MEVKVRDFKESEMLKISVLLDSTQFVLIDISRGHGFGRGALITVPHRKMDEASGDPYLFRLQVLSVIRELQFRMDLVAFEEGQ